MATDQRKVVIPVEVDATGAKKGFEDVKQGAADMASSVKRAGEQAKPFESIQKGGDEAAKKVDASTRSMVASIQRATAQFEAGSKSGARFYEVLAQQRGVNVDVLRPYLAQLDQAKAKAEAATRSTEQLTGGFGGLGTAARSALGTLALFGVPATLGGLAVMVNSIVANVDALNDLKDATGSSIENISALEYVAKATGANFETVSTSLIKFNQALGTTVKPGSDAEKVLKAIGLSAKELRELDPSEALRQTAVALSQFADDGNKARAVQELFGKSLKEVAPFLKDLAEQGSLVARVTTQQAEEAEKFRKELFQVQAALGEAGRALAGPIVSHLNDLIAQFREGNKEGGNFLATLLKIAGTNPMLSGLGTIGKIIDFATPARDAAEVQKELARVNKSLESTNLLESQRLALMRQQAGLRAELNRLYANVAPGDTSDAISRRQGRGSIVLPPEEPKKKGGKSDIELAAEQYQALIAQVQERVLLAEQELSAGRQLTAAELAHAKVLEQVLGYKTKLTEVQKQAVIAASKEATALEQQVAEQRKRAKADLDAAQARDKYLVGLDNTIAKLQEEAKAEQEAAQRVGLSREAIAALDAAKLELIATEVERQAIRNYDKNLDDAEYERAMKIAESWRAVAKAKRDRGAAEAAKEAGDEMQRQADRARQEWERTNQQIADSFVDNLMRGGKSVAQYLKDLFRTLVLRPILQPIGNAFASAANSLFGGGGTAGANSLFGGGGMQIPGLGNIGNLLNFGGTPIVGSSFASTVGGGLATDALGATVAEGAAAATLPGAGLLSTAMPYIGMAVAAFSFLKDQFKGETRQGGRYGYDAGTGMTKFLEGPSGGDPNGAAVKQLIDANVATLNNAFRVFGIEERVQTFTGAYESSEKGRGGVFSGGTLSNGLTFGESGKGSNYDGTLFEKNSPTTLTTEQAAKLFAEDIYQSQIQALQALAGQVKTQEKTITTETLERTGDGMDADVGLVKRTSVVLETIFLDAAEEAADKVPKVIRDLIRGVDAESLSEEEAKKITDQINTIVASVDAFRQSVAGLPKEFDSLASASFDVAAAIIAASGGIENFTSNLASFYDLYFTAEEKRAQLAANLAKTFDGLGLAIPVDDILTSANEAIEGFRNLVLAQDLTTEAGQKAYATLLSISSAFFELNGNVDAVSDTVNTVAKEVADTASKLAAGEYFVDQGDIALAASTAAAEAAESWRSTGDAIRETMLGLRDDLLGLRSSTLAQLQSQFAIATAQARAGDQDAADSLPALAKRLAEAGRNTARNSFEADRNTARIIGSLGGTLRAVDGFARGAFAQPASTPTAAVASELSELRSEQRAQSTAVTNSLVRIASAVETWDGDGLPGTRSET
jgi:hypothetical protein